MITVIPFCDKDAVLQAKNLEWMFQLDGKTNHRCLLSWENGTKHEHIDKIRRLAAAIFAEVKEFDYPESSNQTWPAGPNWAWQNTAHFIPMAYTNKESWFWLEADAVPLKPQWIEILKAEYVKGNKPFMGHIVKDVGHMNGVAVYPNKVDDLCFKPFLVEHQGAWDVVLKEETIEMTHGANSLIQHCWVLDNGQVAPYGDGPVATFRDTADVKRLIDPEAVIFHRCKDGSLIDCLHAMQTVKESDLVEVPVFEKMELTGPNFASTITSNTGVTTEFKVDNAGPPPPLSISYPETEIFIVTYFKDAEWLKYCLHSIRKFARGFTGTTVVCPDRDIEEIEPICREWGDNVTIELFTEEEGKGMLHHMAIKCMADQFCRSDFILHTDSDCIFTEPVTPADYFVDGKPVLLKEAYERFREKHPTILKWKENCEHALGFEVTHETMRRHPSVHPRFIYEQVRRRVEKRNGTDFLKYVFSRKPDYPQGFCEFPLLGGYALAMNPERYHWIDTGETLAPKSKLCQFWSHGGLDRPTDTGAWPGETPRCIIKKILGI